MTHFGVGSQHDHSLPNLGVLAELRALHPLRTLTWVEARVTAEQQAAMLLDLLGVTEPPVPWATVAELPGIVIDRQAGWPASGMTAWIRDHWRIVLKAEEPLQRQRFSLAHELKHVLDDHVVEHLFAHLPASHRRQLTEQLCNHFAACLLMPAHWVERDWSEATHGVSAMAQRYDVSALAMNRRLRELGLHPTASPDARRNPRKQADL